MEAAPVRDAAWWQAHLNARPQPPTQEDVDKEVEEREAKNQELRAAAQARKQARAATTNEQRLEALEAWMETFIYPSPEPIDRERVLADLEDKYRGDHDAWAAEGPQQFHNFRSMTSSSVVDSVFAKVSKSPAAWKYTRS